MMRPRRGRGSRKNAPPPAESTEQPEGAEAVVGEVSAPADEPAPIAQPEAEVAAPAVDAVAEPSLLPAEPDLPAAPSTRRWVINLNMLSNVDVKFYTEALSRADAIDHWRAAIGRAKREQPADTVEVVMGGGDQATSYILYLAEVTAFAVGPSVDDSDAIDCVVNV